MDMSQVLQAETIAESQALHLHFGLGKALADVGENSSAFEHFSRANTMYRGSYDYDIAKDAEYFEAIRAIFSAEFLSDRSDWGYSSKRPIFIVGMMRSGSSLVEQILASHPQVCGCGELQEFDQLTRRNEARPGGLDFPETVFRRGLDDLRLGRGTDLLAGAGCAGAKHRTAIRCARDHILHAAVLFRYLPPAPT